MNKFLNPIKVSTVAVSPFVSPSAMFNKLSQLYKINRILITYFLIQSNLKIQEDKLNRQLKEILNYIWREKLVV